MIALSPETGKLRVYCDECGWRISRRYYSILEGEIDPEDGGLDPRRAEQHLCPDCQDKIWNQTVRVHCHTDCRNKPCVHGECWVNPWPNLMYLCFVGKRIGAFHPNIGQGIESLEEATTPEVCDNCPCPNDANCQNCPRNEDAIGPDVRTGGGLQ